MGLARLGMLVNFVSHSVVVGFSAGAGMLIVINQTSHLLGLSFPSNNLIETFRGLVVNFTALHWPTAVMGISTILVIVLFKKLKPNLPAALIAMIIASIMVYFLGLDQAGVKVIGKLPSRLPPLADLPLLDLNFISRLSTGALAVGSIGLVASSAIARSIAAQTNQRLDSNQEFVGLGLANMAAGFFSGYPCAGSFSVSAINFKGGARTPLSSIFSSLFVLIALLLLAPLGAYLPRTALAGVLIITGYGIIDQAEMLRIWHGARGDSLIMLTTFFGTLLLPVEFAVLSGILLSFAFYIMKTSVPRVFSVLPDENFKHFVQPEPHQLLCPQLGIIKISGDLYFGAVSHVEEAINSHLAHHPEQRFLLLRMQGVNHCDFSGIHMLEAVQRTCQDRGGNLFLMKVQKPVDALMQSTGFSSHLGSYHFLQEDTAIEFLFHKVLDPAVCIYECNVRAFKECQNLPKRAYPIDIPLLMDVSLANIVDITPQELWHMLRNGGDAPKVIDVREPREFKQSHIPEAQLIPLSKILVETVALEMNSNIVLVCRSGRRSVRAACALQNNGYQHVRILRGGMLAWESARLLVAVK
jgi:SulP family sulfate permease